MQQHMQSQQAWIMSQQALSPLVQVMHTPSAVSSHLQWHIARLHWQIIIPFIIEQQLHIPWQSILHKFCSMPQATSSSQVQVIFIPPLHFSSFIVHRGTMHMLPMPGDMAGMPGIAEVGTDMPLAADMVDRSNMTVLDIVNSFQCVSVTASLAVAAKYTANRHESASP